MGSAVLLTYERHHYKRSRSRTSLMTFNPGTKTEKKIDEGCPLDVIPLDLSLPTDGASDSDGNLLRSSAQSSFGTSANAPSETASEDSCSFRRKSICLNGNILENCFTSVPATYVFSQMDLTATEKRDVRRNLNEQLEVIHRLLAKLEARELELAHSSQFGTNQGVQLEISAPAIGRISAVPEVAQSNRVNSQLPLYAAGLKEKRTPKVNQLYVNSEFFSGTDKLPLPEKQKLKPAVGLKRTSQDKLNLQDSKRQKIDNTYRKKMTEIMRQCKKLLKHLMSHKQSWIFNEPVDVVRLCLHDYLTIIKKPMDLGTIKTKLDHDKYSFPLEFAEDVRLTFDNAMLYNPTGHFVSEAADMLKKLFESRWKSLEDKIRELQMLQYSRMHVSEDLLSHKAVQMEVIESVVSDPKNNDHNNIMADSQKLQRPLPSNTRSEVLLVRNMTLKEKRDLSQNIENLPNDKLIQVLQLIKCRCPNVKQTDEEIEVDIDSFDAETLWELQRIVGDNSRNQRRQEVHRTGSFEANLIQPSNGGSIAACLSRLSPKAASEEKVHLSCDEVPAMNHIPYVKEDAIIVEKCTGSSRQYDGDFDADCAHSGHTNNSSPRKVLVGSDAFCDQSTGSVLEDAAKRCIINSIEDNICSKVAMPGVGVNRGGEENISPEKLLRAALLKTRFVDTILKAQEKTFPLSKTDKSDPEKLKREREELERRQREERASLQAEAKAAELAKRKAEVGAAAQARRKREEEREAARLALQKMEKTVEIDENSEILKDLEMLRTVQPEHLQIPSPGEDVSPVHTPEGMPSFGLQGANPLEQLGLFMKVDDEEEEEPGKVSLFGNHQTEENDGAGVEDEEGEKAIESQYGGRIEHARQQ